MQKCDATLRKSYKCKAPIKVAQKQQLTMAILSIYIKQFVHFLIPRMMFQIV